MAHRRRGSRCQQVCQWPAVATPEAGCCGLQRESPGDRGHRTTDRPRLRPSQILRLRTREAGEPYGDGVGAVSDHAQTVVTTTRTSYRRRPNGQCVVEFVRILNRSDEDKSPMACGGRLATETRLCVKKQVLTIVEEYQFLLTRMFRRKQVRCWLGDIRPKNC